MRFLYLDPSSGSILLQLLIAALAGVGIVIASSWQKVKKIFHKRKPGNLDEAGDEEDDE